MRISSEFIKNTHTNLNNLSHNKQQASPDALKTSRKYDAITISSITPQEAENKFAVELSNALSEDIKSTASSPAKLADLKDQINRGIYEIDVNAIASKLLFFGGGNE